jgi:hypothetical protein
LNLWKFAALAMVTSLPFVSFACRNDTEKKAPDSDGSGGVAGDDLDSSSGHGGKTGGTSGASGKGGVTGLGGDTDAAGGLASAGDSAGAAGSGEAEGDLGYLLGPATDDQEPIVVPLTQDGFAMEDALLLADADDNLFTVGSPPGGGAQELNKYDPSLAQLWAFKLTMSVAQLYRTTLSIAPDGGIFFGGVARSALPGETYGGGTSDAVVGKLTPAGTVAWMHQLGGGAAETTLLTTPTSDGGVIAYGSATGQLPGMTSAMANGDWIARYDAAGTRNFLKQYEPFQGAGGLRSRMFIDAVGNVIVVSANTLFKVDSETGAEHERIGSIVPGKGTGYGYTTAASNPDKDAFYCWLPPSAGAPTALGTLWKYGLDGLPLWHRSAEPERSAVIDPVENVIWKGTLSYVNSQTDPQNVAVTADAIYVVGGYSNRYMNGSTPRSTTTPIFVGRYDLKGERVWFQEFLLKSTLANVPNFSGELMGLTLDSKENPVLAVQGGVLHRGIIFKLSKGDGTLL